MAFEKYILFLRTFRHFLGTRFTKTVSVTDFFLWFPGSKALHVKKIWTSVRQIICAQTIRFVSTCRDGAWVIEKPIALSKMFLF